MKINRTVKLFIIGIVILASIVTIPNDLLMILRGNYYLNVNSRNRNDVTKMVSYVTDVKGKLRKVEYEQGLGDWNLYLYYTNFSKEKIKIGRDGDGFEIKHYIQDNGYNKSDLGAIYLLISLVSLSISLILGKRVYFYKEKSYKNNEN